MKRTNTIIIGGGQAGLAMSRVLADRGIVHRVLERGRVGERWRTERWDSLRLLTPRWMSRLPGWSYQGPDPDGYMNMDEVVRYFEEYARSFSAPVEEGCTVLSVEPEGAGYRVHTDRGTWHAANVVVATGYCQLPNVPSMAGDLPRDVVQMTPNRYRNPEQLPRGQVLVVGASSTGIQLAAEIHASGRPVTLAVGRHIRLPRTYRGRDILSWLDVMGILAEEAVDAAQLEAARRQPSLQLVGTPERRHLDLGVLQDMGIRLAGRAVGVTAGNVEFADDLGRSITLADVKLSRLLGRIDAYIRDAVPDAPDADPIRAIHPPAAPATADLGPEGIRTVLWATGYRRNYPWLRVPVLDERGEIRHQGGITSAPGLYVLGLNYLRRRNSTFIDGVGADAEDIARHLTARRNLRRPAAAGA